MLNTIHINERDFLITKSNSAFQETMSYPIMLMLISVTSTVMCHPKIEVIPIETEKGFTVLQLEEHTMVKDYTKILHAVNLTDYRKIIDTMENNLIDFGNRFKDKNMLILQDNFKSLKHNFKLLIPQLNTGNKKTKRGLFNFVGDATKFLFGTMNEYDAKEIYDHLDNLDLNARQATERINNQIVINNNLIKNAKEMQDHINLQQEKIRSFLDDIKDKANVIFYFKEEEELFLELYSNIQIVNNQIQKFTDVILLSRLEVLAHDFLTEEETRKYNITIKTLPFTKSGVLFSNDLLIFVLKVPTFSTRKFFKASIIPIPNSDMEEIDFDIMDVILEDTHIFEYKQEIFEIKYLRQHVNPCIRNLLQQTTKCTFRFNNKTTIDLIHDGIMVTKNIARTHLQQNCIHADMIIANNNIIRFEDCKIKLGDIEATNEERKWTDSMALRWTDNKIVKIMNNITLDRIHQKTIENSKSLSYVEYKSNRNITLATTTTTVVLIVVIIIITLIVIKKNAATKIKISNINPTLSTEDPFAVESK